jgi:hypothetical protein
MRQMLIILAVALLAGTAISPAEALTCRARGVVAAEGETLCIPTHTGQRLARCGRVLNVASWIFLPGRCG